MRSPGNVIFSSLIALAVAAQEAAPSRIEGRVVSMSSGDALEGTEVILTESGNEQRALSALTAAGGRYVFEDLKPGDYRVRAARNGYLEQEYGQRIHSARGVLLVLNRGEILRGIDFRLVRAATISGQITDQYGDPLAAMVVAFEYRYLAGARVPTQVLLDKSNDLGEYRLFGLPPGRYYLGAAYGWPLQRAEPYSWNADKGESYVPTYYPEESDPLRASPIDVGAGEQVRGINVRVLRAHRSRLQGRVQLEDRLAPSSLSDLSVGLLPRPWGVENEMFNPRGVSTHDTQGNFQIRDVLPGKYTLAAALRANGKRYSGSQQIDIGSSDIDNITLIISHGNDLRGVVRTQGSRIINWSEHKVYLVRNDVEGLYGSVANVKADGSFFLENIRPGSYRVELASMPPGYYLRSARLGDRDLLQFPFEIDKTDLLSGTLQLSLGTNGGRINGRVQNMQDQPSPGATVVLIPNQSQRHGSLKVATSDQNGYYAITDIAPGEYNLFTFDEVEPNAWENAHFLKPYVNKSKTLHIESDSNQTLDLHVTP
jgi:protocatechuate 3,4-dioxygenase beta subunit